MPRESSSGTGIDAHRALLGLAKPQEIRRLVVQIRLYNPFVAKKYK